jgi:hypothetical protein
MSALMAADYEVRAIEKLREKFTRRESNVLRFARHAAEVGNDEVADYYAIKAAVWREVIDELAVAIQREQGR